MILLTGSEGNVGRVLKKCFDNLICVDRAVGADIVLNLADDDAVFKMKVPHVDTIIHLAANPSPLATWPELIVDNVMTTNNMVSWAVVHGVKRFIFASSNWVIKGWERHLAPSCYTRYGLKIDSNTSHFFPVNPYGESKVVGEMYGGMAAENHSLESFVAVRIGSFHQPIPDDPIWIGDKDIQSLFMRCVKAAFYGRHVVYGVSAQWQSPYNLNHTKSLLDWAPEEYQ